MNDITNAIEQCDEGILLVEVSDEALEAAGSQTLCGRSYVVSQCAYSQRPGDVLQ